MSSILQPLRRVLLRRDGAGLTDAQLLECYLDHRDELAFEALVCRHGPMVWGVCRRLLQNAHDAEDAFQATFLVLVRKAATILPREQVGNWLYGVAHRTAIHAREATRRRKLRERPIADALEAMAVTAPLNDLRPWIDHELSRLPEKYRSPLVLCDLEGKTRKEAARELNWPEGTVAGRLARARRILAGRLSGHELRVSGGALAMVLAQCASAYPVPASASAAAARNALAWSAGACGVTTKVTLLSQGVLQAMLWSKFRIAFVVVVCSLIVGAAVLHRPALADPQNKGAAASATKKQTGAGNLAELRDSTWILDGVNSAKRYIHVTLRANDNLPFANPNSGWNMGYAGSPLFLEGLPVAPGAEIRIHNRPGKLSDLRPGMVLNFELNRDAAVVKLNAVVPDPQMTLVELQPARQRMKVGIVQAAPERTIVDLAIDPQAKVQIDWQNARLTDLRVDMGLKLKLAVRHNRVVVTSIEALSKEALGGN
jgi:RNA polymerase sigma factor (sigma-70 family)